MWAELDPSWGLGEKQVLAVLPSYSWPPAFVGLQLLPRVEPGSRISRSLSPALAFCLDLYQGTRLQLLRRFLLMQTLGETAPGAHGLSPSASEIQTGFPALIQPWSLRALESKLSLMPETCLFCG